MTRGFCQGEPGSMYSVLVFANLHQSRSAFAVGSGPLPHRMFSGRRPLADAVLSKHATVASASIERSTTSARDSRPNSPITRQDLDLAARCGDVELVVQRPHMVGPLGFEQSGAGV